MSAVVTAASRAPVGAPVRGTQSFVGIMVEVWKRPSLTALEVLWRWAFAAVVLSYGWWRWGDALQPIWQMLEVGGFSSMNLSVAGSLLRDLQHVWQHTRGNVVIALLACGLWVMLSAWGRAAVLASADRISRRPFGTLLALSALRVACLLCACGAWLFSVVALTQKLVLQPMSLHEDPVLVPFAAALIAVTLGFFVAWMAASFVFQLAPVFAAKQSFGAWRSLRAAMSRSALRGKAVEVNLVLGIVKIALIVLALVFSACPLPFSSVATQSFLLWWTFAVLVWYVIASDYFHVVQAVVCLRLWQVYENEVPAQTSPARIAS